MIGLCTQLNINFCTFIIKVTAYMSVCVAKDLATRKTDIALLYSKADHLAKKGALITILRDGTSIILRKITTGKNLPPPLPTFLGIKN